MTGVLGPGFWGTQNPPSGVLGRSKPPGPRTLRYLCVYWPQIYFFLFE